MGVFAISWLARKQHNYTYVKVANYFITKKTTQL